MSQPNRQLHQVVSTWSPYTRIGNGNRGLLRNALQWCGFSGETLSLLRYDVDMALLRLHNFLSYPYRKRIASLQNVRNLRINVGCGNDVIEGWVNVDSYASTMSPKDLLLMDIRRGLPFAQGSALFVYTEHLLEHLDHSFDVPVFLREIYRVLQPGGALRIVVPDCEVLMKAYFDETHPLRKAFPEYADGWLGLINFVARGTGHKYLYDGATLIRDCKEVGFAEVYPCHPGEGRFPELILDNPDRVRRETSLYVEAIR